MAVDMFAKEMKKTYKKIYKKKIEKTPATELIEPRSKKLQFQSSFKNPLFVVSFVVFILLLSCMSFYIFIKSNQDFAANFADNILRPLIGNKSTISLEAFFFNIEDHVNQVEYNSIHHTLTAKSVYAQTNTIDGIITAQINPEFPLHAIKPLINDSNLSGEGNWFPLVSSNEGVLIARTLYRPDEQRPYAVVSLVTLNATLLHFGSVAGTEQPGGPAKPGPGKIPEDIKNSNKLIAAFNGGFQQKDGYYGMIVGNTTYLPLEKNIATFVMHRDSAPSLVRYTGQNLGSDVEAIRQNGPMLIENSKDVTSSNAWNMQTWGLTTTNSMYTWRSGLGVTKDGNVVFASGPSLVPETLAKALLAAGSVNAMQLDINPVWVRFVLFKNVGKGNYETNPLESAMVNGGPQYLNGYNKDFFYVYKK